MNSELIVEQKITAFVNRYAIYAAINGEKTELIALAQQKRFNIKEKIIFYTDESRNAELFSFRAEKIMDVHGKYFVEDTDGNLIGAFRKQFGKSLVRSTWEILDGETPIYVITESNQMLAALRRFVGWIPFVGDILDIIINFFKYHFVFLDMQDVEQGQYIKTTLFRDHYQLLASETLKNDVDWRVLASVAVALDALQSR
jgi:uncharacterized protein YxjI